jgi:hypothetical protein
MLGVLQAILCVLRNVLLAIAWGGVELVNGLVVAIGGFASLLVLLFPPMPTPPAPPDDGVIGFLAWIFPFGGLLAGLLAFCTCWAVLVAARIVLKWIKAL